MLPGALMNFDIYPQWILAVAFMGIGLMTLGFFISRKILEYRLNDELIKNETIDYYKKYPWRPIATITVAVFVFMSPLIKEYFDLKHNQIIYIALLLWYIPNMIGNAIFGGRRALRIKSPQRVSVQ
jgi:hypothetical protein